MNSTYNFNKVILLLKRFFIENKQKELTFWAISLVVFMIFHNSGMVMGFIIISGFIFAARIFKDFDYTPQSMHYLMIPATHAEKLTTAFILNTIYYFTMMLILYVLGSYLGTYLGNMIFDLDNEVTLSMINSSSQFSEFTVTGRDAEGLWPFFISFASTQALFTLGAIYFKRNVVGKTLLSIIAFGLFMGILEIIFINYGFDFDELKHTNIHINVFEMNQMLPDFEKGLEIIKYSLIPFFWIVSYFRLTEKQV